MSAILTHRHFHVRHFKSTVIKLNSN